MNTAVARKRNPLRGAAQIALAVGAVIEQHKMRKHFDLAITDHSFAFARKTVEIAAEAATDGIYIVRTSLPADVLDDAATVRSYKSLSRVERAFRCIKTVDLHVRPIYHWLADRVRFQVGDANSPLPFADDSFDALLCIDSMNHFPDRLCVFQEWRRVLRPGGRAVFTDPVVITGPVTNDELALRSNIGLFLFVPPGVNERFIAVAGFRLVGQEDVTANAALVSGRWRAARDHHRDALLGVEGEERFAGLQAFFAMVHRLTSERRLSRIAYRVEK